LDSQRGRSETLYSYGLQRRIIVVQNGTEIRSPNPEFEASARKEYKLGNDPILLYVGQMDFKKNLRRTLEAAAMLKERGHAFQLVLAGQGRDLKALEAMADEIGLDNIVITGHISDRDLLDALHWPPRCLYFPSYMTPPAWWCVKHLLWATFDCSERQPLQLKSSGMA
jgi:glycosyltransferase involved in cell wall biosynthesis